MPQHNKTIDPRQALLQIYQAALNRVEGRKAVAAWLRKQPLAATVRMIAIGKAAQSMALGAHECLGDQIRQGLIITKYAHLDLMLCRRLGWEAIESAHPLPDSASLEAGERLLALLSDDDRLPLLVLISGGASSLVEAPVDGVDLPFLIRTNEWLLGSGLDIVAMNWVRKGLSNIKGGGLVGWLKGRETYVLAISDVPGDIPSAIGSGLLTPEADLQQRISSLSLPKWLTDKLDAGAQQRAAREAGSVAPELHIVANLRAAKSAAAQQAGSMGYAVSVEPEFLQGEAALSGRALAKRLLEKPPGITIWGGETTVNLPDDPGRGGRNQHLALAAAEVLRGSPECLLLSAGTDGTDGPTEDAGALVDGGTLERAAQEGFDVATTLARADAGSLLAATGDLITTGPTGTNVMDLVIGLRI
jgi:hydroxypyruvate reductase